MTILERMMSGYCFWTAHTWGPSETWRGRDATPNELGGYDFRLCAITRRECTKCGKVESRVAIVGKEVIERTTNPTVFP